MSRRLRPKIGALDIRETLKSHPSTNLMTVLSVTKGITLANAALLLSLMLKSEPFPLSLIPLFIASFAASILTYQAWMLGSIITVWQPNIIDVVYPFLIGMIEFLLFEVLKETSTSYYWSFLFSIFGIISFLYVMYAYSRINPQDYEPSLRLFVEEHKRILHNDRLKAGITALIWTLIGLLFSFYPSLQDWHWMVGILATIMMFTALKDQWLKQNHITSTFYRELPRKERD